MSFDEGTELGLQLPVTAYPRVLPTANNIHLVPNDAVCIILHNHDNDVYM